MKTKNLKCLAAANIVFAVAALLTAIFLIYCVSRGASAIESRKKLNTEIKTMTEMEKIREEAIYANEDFADSLSSFSTAFIAFAVAMGGFTFIFIVNSYYSIKFIKVSNQTVEPSGGAISRHR